MALSEARRASNRRSDAKYQQILLKPHREFGDQIRAAAAATGKSVQGYILDAVRAQMERDNFSV